MSSKPASSSPRLLKARLQLAEAQGRLPPGVAAQIISPPSSEPVDIDSLLPPMSLVSQIREYNFTQVAEPQIAYDPLAAEAQLYRQPVRWLRRNMELLFPLAGFVASVLVDVHQDQEVHRRRQRAQELQGIIAGLGPAIIKGGQALASRPDLLPAEYLDELQRLQDRLPPFPKEEAFAMVEDELGVPFDEIFELVEPEPIAAASIGQVFKARLVANGDLVAIKIQRPGCEEIIGLDLFIMRFYAGILTRIITAFGRKINLVTVIDDFGELIYREIDYQVGH
jgi:predicted unusual protein kinase regulating ubiquinone biosynthesis (AarF/ABC1/UbiB family)